VELTLTDDSDDDSVVFVVD